jgi:hypothetical protein
VVNGGLWAALDPATGKILWQTATPGACSRSIPNVAQGCMGLGPASVANGVVFAASMDINPADPTMFALDAKTGAVIWSFVAGSSVIAGPAIVGNSIYWGSGYRRFGPSLGTPNNKAVRVLDRRRRRRLISRSGCAAAAASIESALSILHFLAALTGSLTASTFDNSTL